MVDGGLDSPAMFADTSMVFKSFLESAVCMCSHKSKYSWMHNFAYSYA